MEESQMLQGREEYRLYSFYLHRSHHQPIKLNVVSDDYIHDIFLKRLSNRNPQFAIWREGVTDEKSLDFFNVPKLHPTHRWKRLPPISVPVPS